jgi:hypothetical protein
MLRPATLTRLIWTGHLLRPANRRGLRFIDPFAVHPNCICFTRVPQHLRHILCDEPRLAVEVEDAGVGSAEGAELSCVPPAEGVSVSFTPLQWSRTALRAAPISRPI